MNVLIDEQAFVRHGRSGITRYFAELVREFAADPQLGITPLTPYRYVANEHLAEALPGRYRRVLLPPQLRPYVLRALNSRRRPETGAPELIHHTLYLPEALAPLAPVRRVCTVYDFTFELHRDMFPDVGPLLDEKQRYLEVCDGLLCISQTTYDDLQRIHPALDKPVEITPLGVGDQFFRSPGPRVPGVPDEYLLHVGSRYAHKNVELLFGAFADIAPAHPRLHLVLCGNRLSPIERERLEQLGVLSRTHCRRVPDGHLPALYAHAAAFVFPSRYEGFGLPVAEAMASGCPALVARAPALVEVAADAALSFDADDRSGLAALLERALADTVLRRRLVDAGRARARELSWRRTAQSTAEAYRRILAAA